jgi:hypothetical protein
MRFWMLVVLALGCGETLPPVDAAQVKENVDAMTDAVNAVALEAADQRPTVDIVCQLGPKDVCGALEAAYATVSVGVKHAHGLIATYAEFGRGLRATQLGVDALEAAMEELAAQADAAREELQQHVVGDVGGSGKESGAEAGESVPERRPAEAADDTAAGAADGGAGREAAADAGASEAAP